jgi:hypothetical protein
MRNLTAIRLSIYYLVHSFHNRGTITFGLVADLYLVGQLTLQPFDVTTNDGDSLVKLQTA